jgi:hypothetical protein
MMCINTYSLVGEYVLYMHHIFSQQVERVTTLLIHQKLEDRVTNHSSSCLQPGGCTCGDVLQSLPSGSLESPIDLDDGNLGPTLPFEVSMYSLRPPPVTPCTTYEEDQRGFGKEQKGSAQLFGWVIYICLESMLGDAFMCTHTSART